MSNAIDIFRMHSTNDHICAEELAKSYHTFFNHNDFSASNFFENTLNVCNSQDQPILIEQNDIFNIIVKLKPNKAQGLDGISNHLVLAAVDHIVAPLCAIFNKSLQSHTFPTLWKNNVVITIPKNKRFDSLNFRPITIMSVFANIFEKVILQSLVNQHNVYDTLDSTQFGFRPNSSVTCALISLHSDICKFLDDKSCKLVSLCTYDIKKAFDQIPHSYIINCLSNNFNHSFTVGIRII